MSAHITVPRQGQVRVRVPQGDVYWLTRLLGRRRLAWDADKLVVPRSRLHDIVTACRQRYAEVTVDVWSRLTADVACDVRCVGANPLTECKCSCGGINHGSGDLSGHILGDTAVVATDGEWLCNRRVYTRLAAVGGRQVFALPAGRSTR